LVRKAKSPGARTEPQLALLREGMARKSLEARKGKETIKDLKRKGGGEKSFPS